ncbi:MAG: phytanoyl-CoA hydroxylase [Candidatus Latescibacterota bacterium]|jgi:phytanoyl-CoA hydroxylase
MQMAILSAHALTPEQVEHFKTQGYLVCDPVFTTSELVEYGRAYDACLEMLRREQALKNIRSGQLDDGTPTEVYQIRCAHLLHKRFGDLIRDPRLLDRVESIIGPVLRLILCQGLYKPSHTGGEIAWHQDDYYFRVGKDNAVVSCWMAFDDATIDNGCMWVLPGAHDRLREHERLESGYAMTDIDEARAVPIELKAGQIMLHHGAMPHRTLTNTTNGERRALAIHYMDATAPLLGDSRENEPPENTPIVRGTAAL